MTGCGCLILVAAIFGLLVFMVFGSTDPGEPLDVATALAIALLALGLRRRREWTARELVSPRGA